MQSRLTILLILCTLFGCSDQQSEPAFVLEQKVNDLKNVNLFLQTAPVGVIDSYKTDSTHPYHYFKDYVSNEKLLELTYHDYPMVRVFTFLVLSERTYSKLPEERFEKMGEVVLGHLTDTTEIIVADYDLVGHQTIADLIIYNSFHSVDKVVRDSLRDLIFDNYPNLSAFSHIISTCNGYEPYYSKIEQINQDLVTIESLIALASFKKEKDIDFIKSEVNKMDSYIWKMRVIEHFPHYKFKSYLEEFRLKYEVDTTYEADELFYFTIASYKDKWAKVQLQKLMNSRSKDAYKSKERLRSIMKATGKYDTVLFAPLREKVMFYLEYDSLGTDYFDLRAYNSWW